jgi:hypothetical protein
MPPKTNVATEYDDIIYPSAIPFVLVHLSCFAASGLESHGKPSQFALRCIGCASLRSERAITDTSHIGLIQPAGPSNSSLPFLLRPAPRRAFCGGLLSIGITICIPILSKTCIHLGTKASLQSRGMDFCSDARHNRFGESCRFRPLYRADVAAQIRASARYCCCHSLLSYRGSPRSAPVRSRSQCQREMCGSNRSFQPASVSSYA